MRYVDRSMVTIPASLIASSSKAAVQRTKAVAHYGKVPHPKKAYNFTAYKSPDVVAALEALFHKKCAYCESKYAAIQPVDVEHFRPKGAVAGDSTHRGYWWLALEWNNLLPSCIDCNRERKQYLVVPDESGQPTLSTKKLLAGKKDAFPLASEVRAFSPNDNIESEEPLLIDPTLTNPEMHLKWYFRDTKLPIIIPHIINEAEDQRGRKSIDVFGLNRHGLVEERASLLLVLETIVLLVREKLEQVGREPPGAIRQEKINSAKEWIVKLTRHAAKEQRYSALASAFIQNEMQKMVEDFGLIISNSD